MYAAQESNIMIINIKLQSYKAIKEILLEDLSKINVICGKNNSGKTTVLEAINKREHRSLTIRLTKIIILLLLNRAKDPNLTITKCFSPEFTKELIAAYCDRCIQKEDWEKFLNITAAIWARTIDRTRRFPAEKMKTILFNLFDNYPIAYLVAQRPITFEEVNEVYAKEPRPGEKVIIRRLYSLKNSNEPSLEHKLYSRLQACFKEITSGYSFDVILDHRNKLQLQYLVPYSKFQWYKAFDCGVGLTQILHLLYFSLSPEYMAILIDEPEIHIHPEMQKKFLRVVLNTDKQLFFSTHSNTFIDPNPSTSVFLLNNTGTISAKLVTHKAQALADLGYSISDNLVSDLVILVEGSRDRPLIKWIFDNIDDHEHDIKIWPLGGNNMEHVDLSVFTESTNVIGIIDLDPESDQSRKVFQARCKAAGIKCYRLSRYAAENYLTIDALRKVFKKLVPEDLKELPKKQKVDTVLRFNPKNRIQEVLSFMTIEDIIDTDLYKISKEIIDVYFK